jgi:uncharacterized membrane protein
MNQYLLSGIIFVLLDSCYLYLIKNYFDKQIKSVQGSPIQINYIGAIITYIILIFGINYFILEKKRSVKEAMLLGFVIYGVYEFTNLAIIKKWNFLTTILDTAWGTILFGLTTAIVYKLI